MKKLLTRLMYLKRSNLDSLGIKREIRGGGILVISVPNGDTV